MTVSTLTNAPPASITATRWLTVSMLIPVSCVIVLLDILAMVSYVPNLKYAVSVIYAIQHPHATQMLSLDCMAVTVHQVPAETVLADVLRQSWLYAIRYVVKASYVW